MGQGVSCYCVNSPHSRRKYRDIADLDEEIVPEDTLPHRTFGQYRSGSVWIPDDIDGLPSTHMLGPHLASDPDTILYDAEIDNGRAFRCIRPIILCWLFPPSIALLATKGISYVLSTFTCDEAICWLRKEYSTRVFYRVYPNRIEINSPQVRIPYGCCNCGSWNSDKIIAHPFDRGAFGFRRPQVGVINYLCCIWPLYGDSVARQRCPCNGPVWQGGWWCDEWPCDMMFCTYRYFGLGDGDETAFASSIALQAYFEGRKMSQEDMNKCVEFWRSHISERTAPVERKRPVMCEPYGIPCCPCTCLYKTVCQCKRKIPYKKDDERNTKELEEVYDKYEHLRKLQIDRYENFKGPVRNSTMCASLGCRRVFGRKGFFFCTEGCIKDDANAGCCYGKLDRKPGDPFPPHNHHHKDIDDEWDASRVLQKILGNPPRNVLFKRWEMNNESGKYGVVTYPQKEGEGPTAYTDEEDPLLLSGGNPSNASFADC